MAYLLSSSNFTFLLILILTLQHPRPLSLALPTLLAFNCTPPLHTNLNSQNLTTLLGKLITNLTHTNFVSASLSQEPNTHHVLVQCNPVCSPQSCSRCANNLKSTIFNLCPNSIAVSAWFENCYLHYFNSKFTRELPVFVSRSNESYVEDRAGFSLALDGLLLQLTAGIRLPSRRGFSDGEAVYDDGQRVFATAECLRSLSPKKCEECVVEAVKEIHRNCSGKTGGFVVVESCRVRFESYRFFFSGGGSDSGDRNSEPKELGHVFSSDDGGNCQDCLGFAGKLVLCIGVAASLGILLGFLIFRNRVCSRMATVLPEEINEKMYQ